MIYYVADTHFDHANIIKYCRRPFGSVTEMNQRMAEAIHFVDAAHNRIIHAGDFGFKPDKLVADFGELQFPENNLLVLGNHDHVKSNHERKVVGTWFKRIVGTRQDWRENQILVEDKLPGTPVKVLVSHLPQKDLKGCAFNVYGHFHNNIFLQPEREAEWLWVLESPQHLNAGVEITDYRPMTLADLIEANLEAKTRVW